MVQKNGSPNFYFQLISLTTLQTKQTWDCCVFLLWLLLVVELCFAVGLMTEAISPSSSKTIFLLGLSVPPRGKHTSALILPALFFSKLEKCSVSELSSSKMFSAWKLSLNSVVMQHVIDEHRNKRSLLFGEPMRMLYSLNCPISKRKEYSW